MRPTERSAYSAIVDRPPLRLPADIRLVVWPILNVEVWEIERPMPRQALTAPTGKFALVAARFNHFVVEHLVNGALDGLKRHDVGDDAIDLVWVPGSYEIPVVAQPDHPLVPAHFLVVLSMQEMCVIRFWRSSNSVVSIEWPRSITVMRSASCNTASGNGGGVLVDNSASGNFLSMSFSRLAGNSAASGPNLFTTSPVWVNSTH